MPNAPKTPPRQIRLPDDLWLDFDPAAKSLGTERASVVRELISWYLREPGARLPERPDRNVVVESRRRREEERRRHEQEPAD